MSEEFGIYCVFIVYLVYKCFALLPEATVSVLIRWSNCKNRLGEERVNALAVQIRSDIDRCCFYGFIFHCHLSSHQFKDSCSLNKALQFAPYFFIAWNFNSFVLDLLYWSCQINFRLTLILQLDCSLNTPTVFIIVNCYNVLFRFFIFDWLFSRLWLYCTPWVFLLFDFTLLSYMQSFWAIICLQFQRLSKLVQN